MCVNVDYLISRNQYDSGYRIGLIAKYDLSSKLLTKKLSSFRRLTACCFWQVQRFFFKTSILKPHKNHIRFDRRGQGESFNIPFLLGTHNPSLATAISARYSSVRRSSSHIFIAGALLAGAVTVFLFFCLSFFLPPIASVME